MQSGAVTHTMLFLTIRNLSRRNPRGSNNHESFGQQQCSAEKPHVTEGLIIHIVTAEDLRDWDPTFLKNLSLGSSENSGGHGQESNLFFQ